MSEAALKSVPGGCPDRMNFTGRPGKAELAKLIDDKKVETLQTTGNITPETAAFLDEHFFKHRPDVALRVYGMYGKGNTCDLVFCRELKHVTRFYADCMHDALNVDEIAAITGLKTLSLGIYQHDNFDVLAKVSDELESLSLGETKSKKPDLVHLARFKNLTRLYIDGHRKNIDTIAQCTALEALTLRAISTDNAAYITKLKNLRELNIYLGGIRDLSALSECTGIARMELYNIRGLSDLSFISGMVGLEKLMLQAMKNVTALPGMSKLKKLEWLVLETMKGLEDISALEHIPNLERFIHIAAGNMQPEDYVPLFKNKHVQTMRVGFGSDKRNKAFRELAAKYDKTADEF